MTFGCVGAINSSGAFGPSSPSGATGDNDFGNNAGEPEGSGKIDETNASAPPISLPAPATGRQEGSEPPRAMIPAVLTGHLIITTPDENGDAFLIGDATGAPPKGLVMAVNVTRAAQSANAGWGGVLKLASLMGALVPPAYAEDLLPDVCELPHHACQFASSEGDFEFSLKGEINDEVSVGIIDSVSGDWLTSPLERVIPPNVRAEPRRVTTVGYFNDSSSGKEWLYSLMPSTASAPHGLVEIMDLGTKTPHYANFMGTMPTRIEVNSGHAKAAVMDPARQFAGIVDLTANNFDAFPKFDIENPTDVALSHDASVMAVTANPDNAIDARIMEIVDTENMTTIDTLRADDLPKDILPPGSVVVETVAVDHGYFHTSEDVDLYAFVGRYRPGNLNAPLTSPFVGVAASDAFGNYRILGMQELPTGCLPKDVVFDPAGDLLVACGGIDALIGVSTTVNWPDNPGVSFTGVSPIGDPLHLVRNPLKMVSDGRLDGKSDGSGLNSVYINMQDGDATHPDSVLTLKTGAGDHVVKRSDAGLRPTGIAIGRSGERVFISTERSHSVMTWDAFTLQ